MRPTVREAATDLWGVWSGAEGADLDHVVAEVAMSGPDPGAGGGDPANRPSSTPNRSDTTRLSVPPWYRHGSRLVQSNFASAARQQDPVSPATAADAVKFISVVGCGTWPSSRTRQNRREEIESTASRHIVSWPSRWWNFKNTTPDTSPSASTADPRGCRCSSAPVSAAAVRRSTRRTSVLGRCRRPGWGLVAKATAFSSVAAKRLAPSS